MKTAMPLIAITLLGLPVTSLADESVKWVNLLEKPIELKIFSEKNQSWIQPSLKLKPGKSADWRVENAGDHNLKLIVEGKEFLMGTYDFRVAQQKQQVTEIAIALKPASGPLKPDQIVLDEFKEGDVIQTTEGQMRVRTLMRKVTKTEMRNETRTRIVMVTTATGTRPVEQSYTIGVPYQVEVEMPLKVLEPVKEGEVVEAAKITQAKVNRPVLVFKANGKPVQVKDSLQTGKSENDK